MSSNNQNSSDSSPKSRRVACLGRHLTSAALGEDAVFSERVADMEMFFKLKRFEHTTRPYTVEQVVKLTGSLPNGTRAKYVSSHLALQDYESSACDYPSRAFWS